MSSNIIQELIKRSKAKKEDSVFPAYISMLYNDCRERGEFISESDGQFTGGYSVEIYRYTGDVYEFGWQDGKVVDMARFDGELY